MSDIVYPEDYFKEGFVEMDGVQPDNCWIEEVDQLSERRNMPAEEYYCMTYLRFDPVDKSPFPLKAFRGFGKPLKNTCYRKFREDYMMYCDECDSDLCNNANIWRPRERRYYNYDEYLMDIQEPFIPVNHSLLLSGVIKRFLSPFLIVTVVILHVIRVVRM
ncbi:hypothetical protein M8J75_015293 [Diaphorina citri]|nr:hypothetical protein M8J75_015293 [Diaphorina citri]